jgi:serine/threonine protein kinase
MTRWYRSPEVIQINLNYGKPGDIWGVGLILAEMMACSDIYYKEEGYNHRNRYVFRGKACYPISPEG